MSDIPKLGSSVKPPHMRVRQARCGLRSARGAAGIAADPPCPTAPADAGPGAAPGTHAGSPPPCWHARQAAVLERTARAVADPGEEDLAALKMPDRMQGPGAGALHQLVPAVVAELTQGHPASERIPPSRHDRVDPAMLQPVKDLGERVPAPRCRRPRATRTLRTSW